MEEILGYGSSAIVARLKPGIVLKYPRFSWWKLSTEDTQDVIQDIKRSFIVEEKILGILGPHPNLVRLDHLISYSAAAAVKSMPRFLGPSQVPRGLLFAEANQGNLQTYLDNHDDKIDMSMRIRWRTQAAAATCYIHQKGVIHSDQRPENYLVHSDDSGCLNIYLTDFGGSTCGAIDGGHLPDSGFFDPRSAWVSTEATDIFSLGSVFYTIMTGHWPYKSPGPFESVEEKCRYEEKVDALFLQGKFPTTEHLLGSGIIQGCWTAQYQDAAAILRDQQILSKTSCIHSYQDETI